MEAVGTCLGCQLAYCGDCLLTTPDGRQLCRSCARTGAGLTIVRRDPGGLAVASLILSLSSFFFCVTAIPGMVLGFVELSRIKHGEAPPEGRGLALAGAITGAIVTGLVVLSVFAAILIAIAVSSW